MFRIIWKVWPPDQPPPMPCMWQVLRLYQRSVKQRKKAFVLVSFKVGICSYTLCLENNTLQ